MKNTLLPPLLPLLSTLQLLLSLLLLPFAAQAQADSLPAGGGNSFAQRFEHHTSSKAYRMTFVSVPLIVGGTVMMSFDRDFRELRNGYSEQFDHDYDDYLQYSPLVLTYGLKACGVRSRSSWGRMVVSNAFAAGLMAAAVNSLKYTVDVERPDGSTRTSFPSGHTATAFMAATILHREYGHRSPWYSILGYAAATATGVTRQLNNRHWVSDIMVGAGIGILSAELGYFFADLIYKDRGLYAVTGPVVLDRYRKPSYLGFCVGVTTALGSYTLRPGLRTVFTSGPSVGIRGAWFLTPHVGIGGRLAASYMQMSVNGQSQLERQKSSSAALGFCFSYPFTARWLLGSQLLLGYEYYKHTETSFGEIGGRSSILLGTGFSMTYAASQHLGVRFITDYDLSSPMTPGCDEWMHRLNFALEFCALF